jgi:asparagine synthase (glutamine-hydrolysing)
MCGIAGIVAARSGSSAVDLAERARVMVECLKHRGPDDDDVWADVEAGVALGHRRLSIIDLSSAGHQPMISADGRFVISYNGEVYSHSEIRADLEARGCRFHGHSDTEVILESVSAFGLQATLQRMIGMFAIALWDRKHRSLHLIRDRLGIKPLYWARFGELFLFGSELKALRAHPGWTPRIDRAAIALFLRHNCIPAPHTIYEGVQKLEPGTILTLTPNGELRFERYWNARDVARNGLANQLQGSVFELTDRLEQLLQDAVRRRMIADVPLGAFLSGGIDSSTVVALMQTANAGPVKTFSIGFESGGYDEAPYARAVAQHLQTAHTELTVTGRQALDVIPWLPEMYDEPFADASQIPTHLVSVMTRRHVTVALSGDGGDEVFAGYNRYQLAAGAWSGVNRLPSSIRRFLAAGLTMLSPDRLLSIFPPRLQTVLTSDKVHKLASLLRIDARASIYRHLVTHWEPTDLMPDVREPRGLIWDKSVEADFPELLEQMQFLDLATYLPDDILTKLDRASMAVALEARVPLLDHRVVEFAWRLPRYAKFRRGTSKWLLRQVLHRHVPPHLVERPKMGFAVPLGEWLRGPLRDWAEGLLDERRLREAGLLDVAGVRKVWSDHLAGRGSWQYPLWDVLMLEAWRERWG